MSDPLRRLPRWLHRPARRGAGMGPRDLARARLAVAVGALLGPLLWLLFALEPAWSFSALTFLVLGALMLFGTLPVALAVLYGYRHRERIGGADEAPLDLSTAVLAASLAAAAGPLLDWLLARGNG